MPGLDNFQKVAGFSFLEREQKPLIQNEECCLGVLLYHLPVRSIRPCEGQVTEKVGKPDIPDGKEVAAGGYAEGAGEIGFTYPGGTHNDYVVEFMDVGTGGEPRNQGLIKIGKPPALPGDSKGLTIPGL